MIDRLFFLLTY